jgi:hypothetical protein
MAIDSFFLDLIHCYQLPLAPPVEGAGAGAAASGDEWPSDPGPFAFSVPARPILICLTLSTKLRSALPGTTSNRPLTSPLTSSEPL